MDIRERAKRNGIKILSRYNNTLELAILKIIQEFKEKDTPEIIGDINEFSNSTNAKSS